MPLFAVAFAAAHLRQTVMPILWLRPDGAVLIEGRAVRPKFTPGAGTTRTPNGTAYTFNGQHGGVLFPDDQGLAVSGSMTASAWIYLRSYVNDGPGAQVLFRGDDRNGLDPYNLSILSDGTINWGLTDDQSRGMSVRAEIPLFQWTHIVASYDQRTGRLALWENGFEAATAHTTRRPFQHLDPGSAPGVGIGNVQNDQGPHNQPLNGMIFNLRLDRGVGTPEDLNYDPHFWGNGGASVPQKISASKLGPPIARSALR